jgi:4-amino-4-deoxy-L-arabinose transferase-like glycosyltransferase
MAKLTAWLRGLPERHGRTTLILLAAILVLGFGLRAYRVVEPLATPGDDAHAYYGLSKTLYTEGSFGGPTFENSSDWSPGAPLLYAASFYATGGAREGTARIVELLLGMATIAVVFALTERLMAGPRDRVRTLSRYPRQSANSALVAAFAVAVYPPFVHSTGALYSEPPAILTLPAAVLAFLWADEQKRLRAWLLPGFLFGLTALARPEYLLVAAAFALLALVRVGRERGWRSGMAGASLLVMALLVPIVPWTVRNEVVLGRLVPISTGGGKALYVGTFLPADGEYQRVKALLARRYLHSNLDPHSEALERVNPTPLFNRVAARYPELPRDSALGKIGKQNFSHWFGEDPVEYLAMTVRKAWRMWSAGVGEAMESTAGRVVQTLIVALGLAGLALLAWRRRWWDLVAMATPIALVTAVGAVSLAASRRNEVLMTLAFPLAAAALSWGAAALLSSRS